MLISSAENGWNTPPPNYGLWFSNACRGHFNRRAYFNLTNTVEPYSRDPLLDAHYKRSSDSQSSFPETNGIYGYFKVCLLDTQDGRKLVISTRSCDFLVTASMRLDLQPVHLGPSTTHICPSNTTRVF